MTNLTRLVKPQQQSPIIMRFHYNTIIRQKNPAYYNDDKDEKQFNIMFKNSK